MALPEAVAVAERRKAKVPSTLFGREEGLPNPQVHCENAPAVCPSSDGRILFSTSLGLLALSPENVRSNPLPPPVMLEKVTLDETIWTINPRNDTLSDGIRNMRQRMSTVGGTFRLESRTGNGTRIELAVPVKPAD